MKFDNSYEPAKPSAIILEIIRRGIESKEMVIDSTSDAIPYILVNDSVQSDIDDFVQRYHDNGGSTISQGK